MRTQSIIAYIYLNRLKERFFIYFFLCEFCSCELLTTWLICFYDRGRLVNLNKLRNGGCGLLAPLSNLLHKAEFMHCDNANDQQSQ